MSEVLISAQPPLSGVLAEILSAMGIPAEFQTASNIRTRLRERADAIRADNREKPPFLLIVQQTDRNELNWLSKSRERFGGLPADDCEWSAHPLAFRDLRTVARPASDTGWLGDLGLIARLAAYSVPIVFIGTFELPNSGRVEAVNDADLLFLDSSVWHRYVSLADPEGLGRLCTRIKDCKQLYEAGRYSLAVAVEFLDFSVRSLRELFLMRSPEEGNHGDFVALHGFHSETEKAKEANRIQDELSGLSPRLLLIDDYAAKGLRSAYDEAGVAREAATDDVPDTKLSKGYIICDALGFKYKDKDSFEWCDSYRGARERLGLIKIGSRENRKPVDIVLLDYLLDKKNGDARWRGTDLLGELATQGSGAVRTGTLGRHWILPVSSFSTVFLAQLQAGRIGNIGRNFTLVAGADPVCTPALFRFRVWDLVLAMRDQASLAARDLEALFAVGLETAGFLRQEPGHDACRSWARSLYSLVSRKREAYDQVASDAEAGGRLAGHMLLEARRDDRLADILDHLELILLNLGWGGTLSPLEAVDRLRLMRVLVEHLSKPDQPKSWDKFAAKLSHAVAVLIPLS